MLIQVEKVSFLNKLPLPILFLRWVFNINWCFKYRALCCVTGAFADYLSAESLNVTTVFGGSVLPSKKVS